MKFILNYRNYLRSLIVILMMFSVFSCKKDDLKEIHYDNLRIAPQIVRVGDSSGTVRLKVYANGAWDAKVVDAHSQWLTVNKEEKSSNDFIIADFKDNAGNLPRRGKILVTLNDKTDTINFNQEGYVYIQSNQDSVVSKANGKEIDFVFESNAAYDDIAYSIKYDDENNSNWIKNISLDGSDLKFTVAQNESNTRNAKVILSFKDAIDDITMDTIFVVQKSVVESVELKPFSYVRNTLMEGVVTENVYIKGVIISDKDNLNVARNPNTSKTNINKEVNKKTVYIQSMDGTQGIKFLTQSVDDNVFDQNTIVELWLKGLTLEKHQNPNYVTLKGVTSANIISKKANPGSLIPRELYMKDLTDKDIYTYVTLQESKISIPDGSFRNINEGYAGRSDTYAMSIRDINGNSMYMLFNYDVPYARNGQQVPQGSGDITGIIVHEDLPRYGHVGQYQIRPTGRSDIDLAEDPNNSFSETLVKWTRFKDEYESSPTASQNPLTPDVGSGTLSASQQGGPFDYGYYGGIFATLDYNGLTSSGDVVSNGGFGEWNWWGTDQGNYWLVETSSAGISTPLSIQFDGHSYIGGPRNWILEWSSTGNDGSWNEVSDFTFPDVVSWGNTLYTQLPGVKSYSFELPLAASGLSTLYIRLRVTNKVVGTSTSSDGGTMDYTGRSRLGYFSIEYNK